MFVSDQLSLGHGYEDAYEDVNARRLRVDLSMHQAVGEDRTPTCGYTMFI